MKKTTLVFSLLAAAPLFATTYTWNPDVASGTWSDPKNWLVDGASAADYPRTLGAETGDEAIFNSEATVSLNGNLMVERVTFNADVRLESANNKKLWPVVESYEWVSAADKKVTLFCAGVRAANGRTSYVRANVEIPENGSQDCWMHGNNANLWFTGKLTGNGLLVLSVKTGSCGVLLACDARDYEGKIRVSGGAKFRSKIAGSYVGGEKMRFELYGNETDNGSVFASDYWTGDTIKFGSFYTEKLDGGYKFRFAQGAPIPVTFEIGHLNREDDRITIGTAEKIDNSGRLKIRKVGTGTLELKDTRHNYGTELNDGVIKVSSDKVLNYYGRATSTLTFGSTDDCNGGTLLYGADTTDYSAIIKNSKKAIAIDTGDDRELVYATALDASNVGGLVKKGPGTLTLTALPAYTGDTTVEAGTLVVPFGAALPGVVTVAEGAHLIVDLTGHAENGTHEILTVGSVAEGTAIEVKGVSANSSCEISVGVDGKVTAVISTEKLVWAGNADATWTSENAWVGAVSGNPYTFSEGDKVELAANGTEVVIPFDGDLTVGGIHVTTANEGLVRLVGAGTITTTDFVNDGDLRLAAGEGTLTAAFKFEGTGTTTFESGTVVMTTSVHQPIVINSSAVALRNALWEPSYPVTGTGELRLVGCTATINHTDYLKDFAGTLTVGSGTVLQARTDLHAQANTKPNVMGLGTGTLKMAGGKINGFGGAKGTNNEILNNVIVADGTVSEWINNTSRGNDNVTGKPGCNVYVRGAVTGAGTLKIDSQAREIEFENADFSAFTGTIDIKGYSAKFTKGFNGGTLAVRTGATVLTNPLVIGANATLAGEAGTTLAGVTFAEGAKFAFLDEGALSEKKTTYIGLTVPALDTLPLIAQEASPKGKWKAVKIANEDGAVSLGAVYRPMGLAVIVK